MFESCRNSGFRITFKNGLTASVQWGAGTYSDNRFDFDFSDKLPKHSDTAEVAVLNAL